MNNSTVTIKSKNKSVTLTGKELDERLEKMIDADGKKLVQLPFELKKIVYENKNKEWRAEVAIDKNLQEVDRYYTIFFVFNEEPYLKEIKEYERKIGHLQSTPSLLEEEDKKEIQNMKDQVSRIQSQLEKDREIFETISFISYVREVKYDVPVKVVFTIPADQVNIVNQHRLDLEQYSLVFGPVNPTQK